MIVAPSAGAVRKRPIERLAGDVDVGEILRAHPVEDVLAGRQSVDQQPSR